MRASHLEILVEELSMEAYLGELLPRVLKEEVTFAIHPFQGKPDLLSKLPARLKGYKRWLPPDWRIVVVVDRDDDVCMALKSKMESMALDADLVTRSSSTDGIWRVATRIAIEELEAWFFGDWDAVRAAYPKVNAQTPFQAAYRHSDDIAGGTWEAFERIMKKHGYFPGGLRKVEAAREIGKAAGFWTNGSPSFCSFRTALLDAIEAGQSA